MRVQGEERAVTVQIGAVLLFGFLIVSMAVYQATVVPATTKETEFDHSERVRDQMQDVRNGILRSAATGEGNPATVKLGASYESRVFFVNPPPATGRLWTVDDGNLSVQHAVAVDGEAVDYWDGTSHSFATRSIRYEPSYHGYDNAPSTVYEHSVLYDQFDGETTVVQSDQAFVDGRRISLVTVGGDLSASGQRAIAVDPKASSAATRRIAVRGDGENVTIALPTSLPASVWRDVLAEELDGTGSPDNDRYVHDVREGTGGAVLVELEADTTYDLSLARIGVGTTAASPTATYLVALDGDETAVQEGGAQTLVVEARDAYNNPVGGVDVTATIVDEANPGSGDGETVTASATTTADGRTRLTYTAPGDIGDDRSATVRVSFGEGVTKEVEFDLTVVDTDGSVEINPYGAGAVAVEGATFGTPGEVVVTFNNTGEQSRTVTEARYAFYNKDDRVNDKRSGVANSTVFGGQALNLQKGFEPTSVTFAPGTTETTLTFYQNENGEGGTFDPDTGDFFVVTFRYDDGRLATYFIGPVE